MKKNLLLFILAISISFSACAEPLILGVQTHYAFRKDQTPESAVTNWLQGSDFKSVRDELLWHDIEKSAGIYTLSGRPEQTVTAFSMLKPEIRPLIILSRGNPLYDNGSQPFSEEGIE